MASLPNDYIERVYAGVLGKLVGVYVGRPFEGWTHQRIMQELGPIRHYVHERLGDQLVVTDDDVSGTFVFLHALDEHDAAQPNSTLSAEDVGRTWLNNVIEGQSVFWWGGLGISTEHTAYLNLSNGIKAPHSGSIATNGKTVAEQIGAQIFIDGWAMVAPGQPELAARLAKAAGSVSHDGESVYAAQLWAAAEAEAFVSADVNHLLDTGLRFIPADSAVAKMVSQVRSWAADDGSWLATRQRIEEVHGYDKYHGVCHVMPNHAIMVMALLYAGDNFHEAMHIINTCGWDTDCNSGNIGCLVALMHGLKAFDAGPDWLGPLADRALISSADGGYSINNAARIALDVASLGFRLAGQNPPPDPKDGSQFHFSLPSSVQGFQVSSGPVVVAQGVDKNGDTGLAIRSAFWRENVPLPAAPDPIEVLTQTFSAQEIKTMRPSYPLMASPLVYPGQTVYAVLRADGVESNPSVTARLRLKHYSHDDELDTVDSSAVTLIPGGDAVRLKWIVPDTLDGQPIQQLGIALWPSGSTTDLPTIWLERLGWTGTPRTVFKRPLTKPCDFWKRAWVSSMDVFHRFMEHSFHVAKNRGEGQLAIGTREWTDYTVTARQATITFGSWAGVAVRIRGLNRYYAAVFLRNAGGTPRLAIIKASDEKREEMSAIPFEWTLDSAYNVVITVTGNKIKAEVGSTTLEATDSSNRVWSSGGIGLVVKDGSLSAKDIAIAP